MLGENHATFLAAEVLASSILRNIRCPMARECCSWNLSLSSLRDGKLHMMFKLGQCAEQNWRKLCSFDYLAKVITSVRFKNGIEATTKEQIAA
jgi:hypothetical protein